MGNKPHFIGATYELTQENMNSLIKQLESANAEISRLQTEWQSMRNELRDKLYGDGLALENARLSEANTKLTNENARLREALESINVGVMSMYLDRDHMIRRFKEIAREALSGEGKEG